ncbi:MAG: MmgE/PrpD family protein [Methylobacteriaceae bacterium]|jgi:2-methylcitrate dehydratase PrpD|nr:MmgE/PrpD family protein [Methylobacteriaceae bacterium]
MGNNPRSSVSEACSAFAAGLAYSRIPAEVRDKVKLLVLDWLGCALRGAMSSNAAPARAFLTTMGGAPQAHAVGEPELSNVVNVAFFNGYVGHILEMDDVDRESISHPGTVVIPAALALSEWLGKNGEDLITAIVAGYEVMLRIGAAVTPAHYEIWHTTGTAGVFGSTAAAGRLLDLPETRLNWAMGSAGSMAAGLWQFLHDGAMSKYLHTGKAAANGVLAAYLAARDFTGASRILEGTQGFFAGYARQSVDESLFEDFGQRFRTLTVSVKPYPCCRHTHSAIDAANALRARGSGAGMTRIVLHTYRTALDIAGLRNPKTTREAKFSLAWCVAATLLKGLPTEGHFSREALGNADIRRLIDKIEVMEDPDLSAVMPEQWPARMDIHYADGTVLSERVESPKGDPGNPVTWQEAADKFRLMVKPRLSPQNAEAVIDACVSLDTIRSAGGITALLSPSGTS